jgi:hypothetical protein
MRFEFFYLLQNIHYVNSCVKPKALRFRAELQQVTLGSGMVGFSCEFKLV